MIWLQVFLVFVIDQLSKYYVSQTFSYLESVPVIPGIFDLTYVRNYGAAFGIFQNGRPLFILVTLITIGLFLYFYRDFCEDWLTRLAGGLAFGGILGNFLDRLRLGYVVDFFDFKIWPVFNIADSAIVVGMIFLAWRIIFSPDSCTQAIKTPDEGDEEMSNG